MGAGDALRGVAGARCDRASGGGRRPCGDRRFGRAALSGWRRAFGRRAALAGAGRGAADDAGAAGGLVARRAGASGGGAASARREASAALGGPADERALVRQRAADGVLEPRSGRAGRGAARGGGQRPAAAHRASGLDYAGVRLPDAGAGAEHGAAAGGADAALRRAVGARPGGCGQSDCRRGGRFLPRRDAADSLPRYGSAVARRRCVRSTRSIGCPGRARR